MNTKPSINQEGFPELSEYLKLNASLHKKRIHAFGRGIGFGAEFLHLIRAVGSSQYEGRQLKLLLARKPKGIAVNKGLEDYFEHVLPSEKSLFIELLSKNRYPADARFPLIRILAKAFLKLLAPNTVSIAHPMPINEQAIELASGEMMGSFWSVRHEIANMLWRFNRKTEVLINELNTSTESAAKEVVLHIRRGDKITEATYTPLEKYCSSIRSLELDSNLIYVATDDHRVVSELKHLLPEYEIKSKAKSADIGYDQASFNALPPEVRYKKTVEFLAEMELMRKTKWFLGTKPSNVYYLANILRNEVRTIDVLSQENV